MESKLIPSCVRHGVTMRKFFNFDKYHKFNWFPTHMAKGRKGVVGVAQKMDCIIEIHDCRLPFSGRNIFFKQNLGQTKPRLLLFNKSDLISEEEKEVISDFYECQNESIIFSNLKGDNYQLCMKKLISKAQEMMEQFEDDCESKVSYNILVVGIPNVGKSTLINRARNTLLNRPGRATVVGPNPGVTKKIMEKIKVKLNPPIYIYDTPGILQPNFKSIEIGFKLSIANLIKQNSIPPATLADYLLFNLNKRGNHSYVDLFKIEEPTDNIADFFHQAYKSNPERFSVRRRCMMAGEVRRFRNDAQISEMLVKSYNTLELGKFVLDDVNEYMPLR